MRKTRSDCVLLNLPEEKQAQLVDWLLGSMPYHQARAMIQKEWGITVGMSALSQFWQEACAPALIARRARAAGTANEVAEAAAASPARFDAATIDALKQRAFELSIAPGANPKDVKAIFALVLKARDQDLDERKIKILEAKAKQADEAEAVTKAPELSPQERENRLREIFGLAPVAATAASQTPAIACAAGASVTLDSNAPAAQSKA